MTTAMKRFGIWLALALLTGLIAAATAATPSDVEQVLAELEGGWYGEDNATPLDVTLRGERHVLFQLARMAEEEIPEMRAQLELQASQSPEEGYSVADIVAAHTEQVEPTREQPSDDEAIAAARATLADRPEDGQAHLELARALGAAIDRNPANGPRYAYEMISSLERSIELDPQLADAYHWLVGYYLNAPPIAGGSLDKAEETARRLAELDPDGAEGLLREIEARGGGE